MSRKGMAYVLAMTTMFFSSMGSLQATTVPEDDTNLLAGTNAETTTRSDLEVEFPEGQEPVEQEPVEELPEGTYYVKSYEDLMAMSEDLDGTYILKADIDLAGEEWVPIGTDAEPFAGIFEGEGHTISHMTVGNEELENVGLFGVVADARISDLKLEDAKVTGYSNVGALAGIVEGSNTAITSCAVETSTIQGENFVGGLFGQSEGAAIDLTYVKGNVKGSQYVGGLVGYSTSTSIQRAYNDGKVTGEYFVGGLAGATLETKIANCAVLGSVVGTEIVGGLVSCSDGTTVLENSYVVAEVAATEGCVGGIVSSEDEVKMTACYYNKQASKLEEAIIEDTEKNNVDMKKAFTFKGWDFESVWTITEDVTYPVLQLLTPPTDVERKDLTEVLDPIEPIDKGDGTIEKPYKIETAEEFNAIRDDLSAYYILTSNIDLKSDEWIPIGSLKEPFTGGLDGNGYAIRRLKISNARNNAGLFGIIKNATLNNITLDNVNIHVSENDKVGSLVGWVQGDTTFNNCSALDIDIQGNKNVGGLIGYMQSTNAEAVNGCMAKGDIKAEGTGVGGLIGNLDTETKLTNCYAMGQITSDSNFAGGLVGFANGGTIESCYTAGTVAGNKYVGGLVGQFKKAGTILNTYALGSIGKAKASYVGGLVGSAMGKTTITNSYVAAKIVGATSVGSLAGTTLNITAKNSFYDRDLVEQKITTFQVDRITDLMAMKNNYVDWDFDSVWGIDEDLTYPYLLALPAPAEVRLAPSFTENVPMRGTGTKADPYLIKTSGHLRKVSEDLTACYKLARDIDLKNVEMAPIGTQSAPFKGSFDGNGYTISKLSINRQGEDFIGLFGATHNATVKNLTLNNISVRGRSYVGGLIGAELGLGGSVDNCHIINSEVTGGNLYIGGLVGYTQSNIINSTSNLEMRVNGYAGGIVGSTIGDIINCSSEATITSEGYSIGGIAGNTNANITSTYFKGKLNVKGSGNVGGLVGSTSGKTRLSYNLGEVTGSGSNVGGIAGKLDGGLIQECYNIGDVIGTNNIGGIVGDAANTRTNIKECFAFGNTQASQQAGGIIGNAESTAYISNCYKSGSLKGQTKSEGIGNISGSGNIIVEGTYYDNKSLKLTNTSNAETSRLTERMVRQSNYRNWDFEEIWQMTEGKTYPYLKNLPVPDEINVPAEKITMVGQGTKEQPYIIKTAEALDNMRYELTSYYKLGSDIDLLDVTEWEAIGKNINAAFRGNFDGQGHTISNLKIQTTDKNYQGLFGVTENATIKNVNLYNATISCNNFVGGFVGHQYGSESVLENCHIKKSTITGENYVGGLIGYNYTPGVTISNCSAEATVRAITRSTTTQIVQQLNYIGRVVSQTSITRANPVNYAGGLIGYQTGNLLNCYSKGEVLGRAIHAGGLVGRYDIGTMKECYHIGDVEGNNLVGGLVGLRGESGDIKDCFIIGNVKGNAGSNVAGFMNGRNRNNDTYSAYLVNCYFLGTANYLTTQDAYVQSVNCYQVNDQMLTQDKYKNWDFKTVWKIEEDNTYPYLRGLDKPREVTNY